MATFVVTAPDGKEYEVSAPEGATQEQALSYFQSQWKPQEVAAAPKETSWGEVAGSAVSNIIPSTVNVIKGVGDAIS